MAKSPDKPKDKSPIQVTYEWSSPERIWSPKSRVWYLSYAALFSILILVTIRIGPLIVILGLLALMALWFIQASIPPLITSHKITKQGIITHDTLIQWDVLKGFWMGIRENHPVLYLDFQEDKGNRIMLILNDNTDEVVFNKLIEYLHYSSMKEAEYGFLAKFVYGDYIPVSKYLKDLDSVEEEEDIQPTEPSEDKDK